MQCPECCGKQIVKNGFQTTNNKQKYLCKDCGRQFVLNPEKKPITDHQRKMIDKLLLERLSMSGISRVVGVSERWLQYYVNEKYNRTSKTLEVSEKGEGELILECDELCTFLKKGI